MATYLATLFVALVAFAAQDSTQSPSKQPLPFEDRDWTLTELHGVKLPADLRLTPLLRFSRGRASGNSGCNRLSASYAASDATLKFGMMASTRMACAPPDVETPFLKALSSVTRYRTSGKSLELFAKDGEKAVARFVAP